MVRRSSKGFARGCHISSILTIWLACAAYSSAAVLQVCTNGCRFSSIGAAIGAAKGGDTIVVGRGTFFENLVIRKSLTLVGSGMAHTVIDGAWSNRVMTITSNATVVLRDLTIRNGRISGPPGRAAEGGGVRSEGFLTLRNVAVVSNMLDGGYSVNEGIGGAARGGGVFCRGRLSMVGCSLVGNVAFAGGGIYGQDVAGVGGDATGAGIYSDGRLDAVQCMFSDNVAVGGVGVTERGGNGLGGAVYCRGGPVRIHACRLARNSVQGEYGFGANPGYARGGGLYNDAIAEVADTLIESNDAVSFFSSPFGEGGGAYNASTLSVSRCAIIGNGANFGGGWFSTRRMLISKCLVNENSAQIGGGAFSDGVLEMRQCRVRANCAMGSGFAELSGYGGGLYNASTACVTACWFESNRVTGLRGELCGGSAFGAGVFSERDLVILDSTLNGNLAQGCSEFSTGGDGYGGALFNGAAGRAILDDCTLSGNAANGGSGINAGNGRGGGIYNQGDAALNHCTLITNMAAQGTGYAGFPYSSPDGDGSGGGMYSETPVQVCNSIVAGNGASVSGFDCSGVLLSEGYNLIESTSACSILGVTIGNVYGVSPLVGLLQAAGGFAPTHSLLPGSPAIDAGTANGLATDQRGAPRPVNIANVVNVGDGSDIGAFESRRRDVAVSVSASPEMPVAGWPITYTVDVANIGLSPVGPVSVLDRLPRGIRITASAPRAWNGGVFCDSIAYDIGNLAVAARRVITLEASVCSNAGRIITNTAWVVSYPRDDLGFNNESSLESVQAPPF